MVTTRSSSSHSVAPPKKQVSTISTTSEIPKKLYDVIQRAAKCRKSLKLNSNNRFAKRKLEHYECRIPIIVKYYQCYDELPSSWEYNPETSFMAHVPKPPTPPKPKPKTKRKKIRITWSSPNYHGPYLLDNEEQNVWNNFRMNDTTEAQTSMHLTPVKNDDMVLVDLLGNFAVDTFNKSCHMYVNEDEDKKAIEQGKPGVYEAGVECVPDNGARTLQRFFLTDREPEWKRPWAKPHLESESEFEYETVEDGSSDPQDFYKLTGMVRRRRTEGGGGFNYHNPPCAPHRLSCNSSKDEKGRYFVPNVTKPLTTSVSNKNYPVDLA